MFSTVHLDAMLTQATYGYDPLLLTDGSHSKVVVVCDNCNSVIHREKRHIAKKHQCPSQVGDQRRCYRCGDWKDVSLFNKSRKNGAPAKMCRQCYNEHPAVKKCESLRRAKLRSSFENDIEFYFRKRADAIRNKCKSEGITFDLDGSYLFELWQAQSARCYYTNIPMARSQQQHGFQCWDAPSIDRKVPSLGYTKDNVVLCCFSVNSFKQSLNEEQFAAMLKQARWWFDAGASH